MAKKKLKPAKNLRIILALLIIAIIGINIYFMSNYKLLSEKQIIYTPGKQSDEIKIEEPELKKNIIKISTDCNTDIDCSWKITNCCTENAGGYWQCINKESQIECNELVLCPQVVSAKPERACSCVEGKCSG
ncbi:MAG: hypothetical protein HY361_03740 [Candidatus Aenigmarchaeota archaeon]|nr:hypothetical protein [Candidatus Aenigmarchaeota archaeon]